MAKLLIAENELALREFIARGLEQRGHKVTTAQDGSEAVEALKKHKFDLLLGRRTYEIFKSFWPQQTDPTGDAINERPPISVAVPTT